jgi:hypothetical protein
MPVAVVDSLHSLVGKGRYSATTRLCERVIAQLPSEDHAVSCAFHHDP